MKPIIAVTHAAFDERRRQSLNRILSQLRFEAPGIQVVVQSDFDKRGSLWCWTKAMESALMSDATHVTWLPDDGLVCRDFGAILKACIAARPDDIFDCFVNHPVLRAGRIDSCWYSTSDGYVGIGGTMPRKLLEELLRFREAHPELDGPTKPPRYSPDAGTNLWAALTGRRVYKTAWSLVTHDESLESHCGHETQSSEGHIRNGLWPVDEIRSGVLEDIGNFLGRTFAAPEHVMPGHARSCVDLPPTYKSNVFDIVRRLEPKHWDLDNMYRAASWPLMTERKRVVILVPRYHEDSYVLEVTDEGREAVRADLEAHGIECIILRPPQDSHVDRMRQRAVSLAMKHGPTHILWWDCDIEVTDPTCVRQMIATGHDVVAGACPYRDDTGRVVCNVYPETERVLNGEGGSLELRGGCLEVRDAGTGFMLVSRECLLKMMQAYSDLCHLSRGEDDKFEPMWALWDANLVGREYPGDWPRTLMSRELESEDWYFCRLWQELGGKVYIHVPSKFRHWGLHPYTGSFESQWGMKRAG